MTTNDKEKRKKWDKKYRENHQKKVKESTKKYQDSEGGKAKRKKWREDNPEKIKARDRNYRNNNKDRCNKNGRKYYNTIKGRLKMLKRHDAKRLDTKEHKLTPEILKIIDERDNECVYCGNSFNNDMEHDHLNPFKQFSRFNIVRCCRKCNRGKSSSDMVQWMNFKEYKISQKLLDLYKKAYS